MLSADTLMEKNTKSIINCQILVSYVNKHMTSKRYLVDLGLHYGTGSNFLYNRSVGFYLKVLCNIYSTYAISY